MNLAGQHLEECRLAGAVGTDDAAPLAAADLEIDVAVGDKTAIALAEADRLQYRAGTPGGGRRRAVIAAAAALAGA